MKKMDKSVKVLIVMAVITIVLFGLNTYIKKSNKIDYSDKEYIDSVIYIRKRLKKILG